MKERPFYGAKEKLSNVLELAEAGSLREAQYALEAARSAIERAERFVKFYQVTKQFQLARCKRMLKQLRCEIL